MHAFVIRTFLVKNGIGCNRIVKELIRLVLDEFPLL